MKKVLIPGVNGFIGHHLSKRILETTDREVHGMSTTMADALRGIFDACRGQVGAARALMD